MRQLKDERGGVHYTFGSNGPGMRYGSAWPGGKVLLFGTVAEGVKRRHVKCRSYRVAVRRLREFLRGH